MRNAVISFGLMAVLGFAALGVSLCQADETKTPKMVWEYKVVNLLKLDGVKLFDNDAVTQALESKLNELGAEGWELGGELQGAVILKRQK